MFRNRFNALTLFDKDGGGSGGNDNPENGNEQDGNPTGSDVKTEAQKGEKLFSQAELDAKIAERLARAEAKQKADAEKARREAETNALKEQEKFKELSESQAQQLTAITAERDAAIAERDAAADTLEKYGKALNKILDTQKTAIPEHVKPLLEKLPLDEQYQWLADNQDKLKVEGVPATPRPDGQGMSEEQRKQAEQQTNSMYRTKF